MSEQWLAIVLTLICALTVHVSIFVWWRRKWGVLGRFGWPRPKPVVRATVISDECETLVAIPVDAAEGRPASGEGERAVATELELERFAALQAIGRDRKNPKDAGGDPVVQGRTG